MINQEHIEALYDCFDESAVLLYGRYKTPYLESIVKTCENIMANSVEDTYSDIKSELEAILEKVSNIEFNKEEIRKAFQYACLKGFKHGSISNQMITPETVGIFINYLISKLYSKKHLNILDPLVGTGNLITYIANNLNKETNIFGVDFDSDSYKLSTAIFDMLGYGEQVYFQDTITFKCQPMDLIVSDFSGVLEEDVYNIIGHLSGNIVNGGFLMGIFDSETVKDESLVKHAQDLNNLWKLFGFIKLPENILKKFEKVIVIFQRDGSDVIQPKKFLLVDLPDFNDQEGFKKVINHINIWFENIEFYKLGE
jgi:site-specific DNA-methyltransferase (adenine-specific)